MTLSVKSRWVFRCLAISLMAFIVLFSIDLLQTTSYVAETTAFILPQLIGLNSQKGSRPNIIFILADDLGYNDVGYNSDEINTPNIDYLAMHGIMLSNYYTLCICSASRGVILTGRYDIHNGLTGISTQKSKLGVKLNETLIPQVLKKYGNYSTFAIGKWHIGKAYWTQTPTWRGFDYFYGHLGGAIDYYTKGAMGGFDFSEHFGPNCNNKMNKTCARIAEETYGIYSTNVMSDKAVEIIDNYQDSDPFFIYLAYNAIHSPPQVPLKYFKKYNATIKNHKRATAAAMIDCIDEGVGDIINILTQRGFLENTIIIFTSDNGAPIATADGVGGQNWPLRGAKHSIWEGGTKVPALIYYPLQTARQSDYNGLFHSSDWFATLLDYAHIDVNTVRNKYDEHLKLDGISHWNELYKSQPNRNVVRNFVYYGYDNPHNSASHGNKFGLRYKQYKYMWGGGGNPNLWYKHCDDGDVKFKTFDFTNGSMGSRTNMLIYDLDKDPLETRNIYNDMILPNGNKSEHLVLIQDYKSKLMATKFKKDPARKSCKSPFVPFSNITNTKLKGGILPGC